jgi:ferredoxin-NADP reductase
MAEKPRDCRARVVAVRALTAEVREADLAMEEPPRLVFDAGQWISIRLGEAQRVRAYSIASAPAEGSRITLAADIAPGGIGSQWFRGLAPGDTVRFKGPLGGFVTSAHDSRRLLFVAEEIGIVPIRALLGELAGQGFPRPATLVYWARDPGWLVYDGELASLARRFPDAFAYHPVVAEGAGSAPDAATAVERLAPDATSLVAYVAGGERTIHAVRDLLVARGLDRKSVKWEKFW